MRKLSLVLTIISTLSVSVNFGWQQQTPTKPTKPTTPSTGPTSTPSSTNSTNPRVLNFLSLSGTVILQDGSKPIDQVQIEFLCNGRVIKQTQASTNGGFHFEIGRQVSFAGFDASVNGAEQAGFSSAGNLGITQTSQVTPEGIRVSGRGRFDLNNCEIRAAQRPGYKSNRLPLGFRSVFDKPDVGVIVMRSLKAGEGTLVSLNTLTAPDKARKSYEKAQKELGKKKVKYGKVTKELRKAVKVYPEFAEAWNLLAEVHLRTDETAAARDAFLRAVEADKSFIAPYLGLARMDLKVAKWDDAVNWTTELIRLDSSMALSQYFHGMANYYLAKYEAADKAFSVVAETDEVERYPATFFMQGDILLRRGQVPEAASAFRKYLNSGQAPESLSVQLKERLDQWETAGLIEKEQPLPTAASARTVAQDPPEN